MIQKVVHPPRIAVCLAAFNGSRWLPDQLASILAQVEVCVTVFISVDTSSDGTEKWVSEASEKDSRIVVLPHGRHFGGAAPNFYRLIHDVDFGAFDYISFADQDDVWLPDKLFRACEKLSSTGADAYSSNVTAFWPDGRQLLINKSQEQVHWDFLFEAAGPGCTYVMKKELVCDFQKLLKKRWVDSQSVGLHDWFIYAFARANGYRWVIDDYAGMKYRQHGENQVGVNMGWVAYVHRARKILNGWGLSQSALIAELVGLGNDSFVTRWSGGQRSGLLWLACHAGQCRRRFRDKLLFALSCLAICFAGKRRQ